MKRVHSIIGAVAVFGWSACAGAATITFDELAPGSMLGDQYAATGVVFSANPMTGPGSSSSGMSWATNTDMRIVSLGGGNVGSVGTPSLVSGNVLRSLDGWLSENGDASFLITFLTPVTSVSLDFAGVSTPADVRLLGIDGAVLASGTSSTGQLTLSYASSTPFASIVVAPGSFDDWVGVDNVSFAPVPEPAQWALLGLGLGALAWRQRRR